MSWSLGPVTGTQESAMTDEDLDLRFGDRSEAVTYFSATIHAQLVSNTTSDPWAVVDTCPDVNGLEAIRV